MLNNNCSNFIKNITLFLVLILVRISIITNAEVYHIHGFYTKNRK